MYGPLPKLLGRTLPTNSKSEIVYKLHHAFRFVREDVELSVLPWAIFAYIVIRPKRL